jgi:hypothetical protein
LRDRVDGALVAFYRCGLANAKRRIKIAERSDAEIESSGSGWDRDEVTAVRKGPSVRRAASFADTKIR